VVEILTEYIRDGFFYRKLQGSLKVSDYPTLYSGQTLISGQSVKNAIIDMLDVTEDDDEWPIVFAKLHEAMRTYVTDLTIIFISDKPVITESIQTYINHFNIPGWVFLIVDSIEEAEKIVGAKIV